MLTVIKTYLTRMSAVCKTCESYALIRREILSTQNSSCDFTVWDVVKTYARVFGAYTKLVYNDLDVFEKLLIRRIIRRKIRSRDRPISNYSVRLLDCSSSRFFHVSYVLSFKLTAIKNTIQAVKKAFTFVLFKLLARTRLYPVVNEALLRHCFSIL